MCLLVPVETRATRSLQSFFRQEDNRCSGNLLQIHFNGNKPWQNVMVHPQ